MAEIKENIKKKLDSVMLIVAKVLREFPETRSVRNRDKLLAKSNELAEKELNPESVYRVARKIQNDWQLYLPKFDDRRYEMEQAHREYFRNGR